MPADTALVAVGGYGRGELFPYSDIDVLVLLPERRRRRQRGPRLGASSASSQPAGTSGLEIGSSVRTVDECVDEGAADVTVQTALLEARYLCGARKVFNDLPAALSRAAMDPKGLPARPRCSRCASATRSSRTRPTRSNRTARKARAACATCRLILGRRAAGFGRTWQELAAHGLITAFEVRQLQRNEAC